MGISLKSSSFAVFFANLSFQLHLYFFEWWDRFRWFSGVASVVHATNTLSVTISTRSSNLGVALLVCLGIWIAQQTCRFPCRPYYLPRRLCSVVCFFCQPRRHPSVCLSCVPLWRWVQVVFVLQFCNKADIPWPGCPRMLVQEQSSMRPFRRSTQDCWNGTSDVSGRIVPGGSLCAWPRSVHLRLASTWSTCWRNGTWEKQSTIQVLLPWQVAQLPSSVHHPPCPSLSHLTSRLWSPLPLLPPTEKSSNRASTVLNLVDACRLLGLFFRCFTRLRFQLRLMSHGATFHRMSWCKFL